MTDVFARSVRARILTASIAAVATAAATLTFAQPALAASTDIVISEVYGGGGNSGATYTNDFIELRNLGAQAVDVTGWTVQYASAAGTSWQTTALSGSIDPGATYLVQEGAGAGGTTPLPTPQATGSIAMSGTNGKVALVDSSAALSCGPTCAGTAAVKDFLGYGSATDFETASTPALSNTTSAARAASGPDTDNNSVDFTIGTPTPAGAGGGGPVDPPPTGTPYTISQIQGPGHLSPVVGEIAETTGIVTAVAPRSYWIQSATPDSDPDTSEGLLVFVNAAPNVAVGDAVSVVGKVTEFRSASAANDLHVTELTAPTSTVLSSANPLPAATLIGSGGLIPPSKVIENETSADIETTNLFDPASDGIDFWEALEGMRVVLNSPQVVGPTSSFGELPVVPVGSTTRTNRGGILLQADDTNPERIILDDVVVGPMPLANVGDTLTGQVTGVIDYSFSNPKLNVTTLPTVASGGLAKETTAPATAKELSVATFNVENLSPNTPAAKFTALAQTIVTNLASPDVVALEEVQDNNGATDNGVVDANLTLDQLVAAIVAAGGPAYTWSQINPADKTDGGQPGGNIRVAFLYRTDRGLQFVSTPGGDTSTAVGVTGYGNNTHLTSSPGRIDPGNVAWASSRKPLVGEFRWQGKTVFVIANHFNSKGGDTPLYGTVQPPTLGSEAQRLLQAKAVAGFVDKIYQRNIFANVVVLGDLNDFEFSAPLKTLTGTIRLVDLVKTLPLKERYTYVYQGNSQSLDHILISPALVLNIRISKGQLKLPFVYDIVHVNSEFADQVSDHDPQVVKLFVNG